MAFCKFGHFYLVSKISQKLLELEPQNLMNRLLKGNATLKDIVL